ncbi:unnamed protein product [Phytomonas sp. EM1]|nr:unnamed protein product [Phytomonas sp. EM1]|eukprot:CCW61211.1 unnamed protein product [Phytomonas sp. isolate EM1]
MGAWCASECCLSNPPLFPSTRLCCVVCRNSSALTLPTKHTSTSTHTHIHIHIHASTPTTASTHQQLDALFTFAGAASTPDVQTAHRPVDGRADIGCCLFISWRLLRKCLCGTIYSLDLFDFKFRGYLPFWRNIFIYYSL